jgi:predicted metalloprotease with PDZ domain
MLPYITRDHRWISEGFAQYYQNVLLTRSGAYDENYAWQKIVDGLERGRLSRPELSPNGAAADGRRSGGMKVYWAGAAVALIADVELRERSDGAEGLSDVLGRFQKCCLPAREIWTGPEFFEKLDTFLTEPLFVPLYRRYAETAGFPDTSDVLARLGVSVSNGKVSLKRNAELARYRDAITETDSMTAAWRNQLAAN